MTARPPGPLEGVPVDRSDSDRRIDPPGEAGSARGGARLAGGSSGGGAGRRRFS